MKKTKNGSGWVAQSEEHADFLHQVEIYGMNQSEFIREAISGATIRPVIIASNINDAMLESIGKLTAEFGKIGNNLNQIARHLNEWHTPYPNIAKELQNTSADLASLKFEVMEKVAAYIMLHDAHWRHSSISALKMQTTPPPRSI